MGSRPSLVYDNMLYDRLEINRQRRETGNKICRNTLAPRKQVSKIPTRELVLRPLRHHGRKVIYKFLTLNDFALGLRKLPQNSLEIILYGLYVAVSPYTSHHRASYAHILCLPRVAPAQTRYQVDTARYNEIYTPYRCN